MRKRITCLADLVLAREQKRAVTCDTSMAFKGPIPAAFVLNLSGEILFRLISGGMWVYEKK